MSEKFYGQNQPQVKRLSSLERPPNNIGVGYLKWIQHASFSEGMDA